MKKRVVSFLLCVAMLIGFVPVSVKATENFEVSIGTATVAKNSTQTEVELFATATNWPENVGSFQFTVTASENVFSDIKVYAKGTGEKDKSYLAPSIAANNNILSGYAGVEEPVYLRSEESSGVIFRIVLTLKGGDIYNGTYPVTFVTVDDGVYVRNTENPAKDIAYTLNNGSVIIQNGVDVKEPVISAQPAAPASSYALGASATALTVATSFPTEAKDGTLSYQWYSNTTNSTTAGTAIAGATSASYTPSTANAGTTYYYCVVTNTLNGKTATATSDAVAVTVNQKALEASMVTLSSATGEYNGGAHTPTVTVTDDSVVDPSHYDVTYKKGNDAVTEMKNAGEYKVVVTGKDTGNYSGSVEKDYTITAASIADYTPALKASPSTFSYTGSNLANAISEQVEIKKGSATLTSTDYTLAFYTNSECTAVADTLTNAGTYYFKATGKGNYTGTTEEAGSVVIGKASNGWVAEPAANTLTYTGEQQALVTAGTTSVNSTVQYKLGSDGTYGETIPTGTNAGSYTVYYKVDGGDNYDDVAEQSITVTIAKANITPTVTMKNWVFGQSAAEPAVSGNTDNGAVTFEYKAKDAQDTAYSTTVPTSVGEYTVRATIAETTNYNGGTATADFQITKTPATLTTPPAAVENLTYNKTAQALVTAEGAQLSGGTKLEYQIGDSAETAPQSGSIWNDSIPTGTNAGTYYVWCRVVGDANHSDSEAQCVTVNIAKKTVAVSGIKAQNKTYDGETAATLDYNNVAFDGLISGDTLTVSATGTFDSKGVGTNKTVTITELTLSGESVANYVLAGSGNQTSTKAEISKKQLTVTDVTAASKEYDGTTTATVNKDNAQLGGVITGDKVSIATATGTFDSEAKGNNKTVTITFTLTGTDAANYEAASATTTAGITNTRVYISGITAQSRQYDGTTTATVTGTAVLKRVTGDTEVQGLTVSNITAKFAGKNKAEDVAVTIEGGTLSDSENYTLALAETNAKLNLTANITACEITVSGITAENKTYDGKTTATLVYSTAKLEGKVAADDLTVTATGTFENANAGAEKTVNISNLALDGTAKDNYVLAASGQQTTATATINPQTITPEVTLSATSGNYTGSNQTPTVTVKVSNESGAATLVENTDYTLTWTKGNETVKQIVDVGDYTLTVASKAGSNYSFAAVTKTFKMDKAAQAAVTVSEISGVTYGSDKTGVTVSGGSAGAGAYSLVLATEGTDKDKTENEYVKITADTETGKFVITPKKATETAITVYGKRAGGDNYADAYSVGVTFTIAKAALTVTAKDKTITYGDAPANDGVTYTGFVKEETESVLGGTLAYEYNYNQYDDVGAGSYTITPKGLTSDNYTITFATGTLTVVQKEITEVTWGETALTYTGAAQVPAAVVKGLVTTDSGEVTVTVTGGQTNANADPSGELLESKENYTATVSALAGGKAANYKLATTKPATQFTIKQVPVTITGVKATWNGTAATLSGGVINGLLSADAEKVAIELPPTGTVAANASGANVAVTATIGLKATAGNTGADKNYSLTSVNAITVDIPLENTEVAAAEKGSVTAENATGAPDAITAVTTALNEGVTTEETGSNTGISDAATAMAGNSSVITSTVTDAAETAVQGLTGATPVTQANPVVVVVVPFIDMEVKSADMTASAETFTVDITPKYKLVATTKSDYNNGQGGLTDANSATLAGSENELTVTEPVKLSVPVPAAFYTHDSTNHLIFVKHTHGNATYEYVATVKETAASSGKYVAEFTTPHGFSEFVFALEQSPFMIDDVPYANLAAAVAAVKNGETITVTKAMGQSEAVPAVGRVVSFTIEEATADNYKGTITAAAGYENTNATTKTDGKAVGTYTFVKSLSATASPSSVAAGTVGTAITPIQITAQNGTAPYTFGKTSGPDWLSVDESGKVTGTRPSAADASPADFVVAVADATGKTYSLTITVGAVSTSSGSNSNTGNTGAGSPAGTADNTTAKISTSVSGTTATVTVKDSDLAAAAKAGSASAPIVIDVSKAGKTIDTVSLPAGFAAKVSALETAGGLEVALTTGELTFNDKALDAIAAAGSGSISLSLEKQSESSLAAAQKTALAGMTVSGVYDLSLKVTGKAVESFNGGTATVSVPFTPAAGTKGSDYVVLYVSDAGATERMATRYLNCELTFTTGHFSTYVVVYDPAQFTDVVAGSFYEAAVKWAVSKGITDGTSATTFSPDAPCTRAQAVTFLYRAAGEPEVTLGAAFTDVKAGSYYEKAVAWAVANGITNGTSATTFSPDAACTRAQIVTFLAHYEKAAAVSSDRFTDVAADAYYAGAVGWAAANGITDGTSATKFSPEATCTRAQIVTFLYRDFVK